MRQCFGALLCVCVVGARSRPAAADAVTEDAALAIAIEMYVDPVLAVRVSDLDPSRYETYVRELFRGTAPETPIVVEGTGTRRASHVFVIDFAPAEQRGMVRVTVSVKLGRGVTRRMELARVATTTVASGDGAAFETFLRQQVARVVALYRLRDGGVPDAAQGRTGDRAMPVAELGMT
ncbi:hypothetical protein HY634_00090, partial [Candidatus Uhrbacteria bacterium]|nr:hypothetical protein [Candidatus Uhrbacteria bacterium]